MSAGSCICYLYWFLDVLTFVIIAFMLLVVMACIVNETVSLKRFTCINKGLYCHRLQNKFSSVGGVMLDTCSILTQERKSRRTVWLDKHNLERRFWWIQFVCVAHFSNKAGVDEAVWSMNLFTILTGLECCSRNGRTLITVCAEAHGCTMWLSFTVTDQAFRKQEPIGNDTYWSA